MAFWRGFCCAEMVRYAREGYPTTKHGPSIDEIRERGLFRCKTEAEQEIRDLA